MCETPPSSATSHTSATYRDEITTTRWGGGSGYPEWRRHGQVAGGERTRARDYQVVDAPGTLDLAQKATRQKTSTRLCQDYEENSGRTRQGHRDAEGPATSEPPRGRQVPGYRLREAKGGANRHRNGSRHRHVEQGAGTSGVVWRMVVAGGLQLGGAFNRERRWGSGVNKMDPKRNGCGWGGW